MVRWFTVGVDVQSDGEVAALVDVQVEETEADTT